MLKKILIVLLLTIPLFFLSWNFKYYSQNYNIADSAVYNQVLNSIIFQGETGSSLELGGERSTFNIHFSPIFLLLAPFKILWFTDYILEFIQILNFICGLIILLIIFKYDNFTTFFWLAGLLMLPQAIGLLFTSFRTVKLCFILISFFYFIICYKKNNNKTRFSLILIMILILSLIETNYFLGAGVILYLLILNFDISTIFKLSIILLLFFAFSLIFLDYSRHREFLNFSSFDFFQALNYFLLIFIVFLGIFTFDKILIIALPYILSVCYSNVSNFFNFSNIDFLPTINFYYAVPIITLLLIALLKKIKTCQMQILNKKIFVLPIIFFFLSANYGLKEKIIFFDFLNNNNAIEYSKIAKLKEKIPREEKLYVQWLYADLFSDYHNLKFYSTTFKNEKKIDGNIFLDLQLDYLDISDNDAIAFANEINYIKKLIEQNVYKIIYIDDRYLIFSTIPNFLLHSFPFCYLHFLLK